MVAECSHSGVYMQMVALYSIQHTSGKTDPPASQTRQGKAHPIKNSPLRTASSSSSSSQDQPAFGRLTSSSWAWAGGLGIVGTQTRHF